MNSSGNENNKVGYWLEKLFNQEVEKKRVLTEKLADDAQLKMKEKHSFESKQAEVVVNYKKSVADMVQSSNTILMSLSTFAIFNFFPTTINVEASRVTLITRQLFSSQVHSIDIRDISNVFIETSILFASIRLVSKTYSQKEFVVKRLWKKEAIMLRRIVEGLRMFEKNDINVNRFSKEELLSKLKELSSTKIVL